MLLIAIAISFAWHIFWLSAVKIISSPVRQEAVKFSKISFLGPILSRANMVVRAAPAERSFLEKRYRRILLASFSAQPEDPAKAPSKHALKTLPGQASARLGSVIDDAVGADKLEPDYPAE